MRFAIALLLFALPLSAAKKPTVPQLQTQVKQLTTERDDLKQRLAATEDLQQELMAARKSRDLAKAEADVARKEVEQVRASQRENQEGGDAIVKELQGARQAAGEAKAEVARIKVENESLQRKASTVPVEGDLVVLGEDLTPARAINLNRITPRIKSSRLFSSRPKGAVVVNVLISEKGDVLAARLIQGLPGDTPEAREADEACLEAAKRIVFDPAAAKDGKTRFKVWQGVGFFLD